jgi:hypothetical protein
MAYVYVDTLDPDEQVTAEEEIAAYIHAYQDQMLATQDDGIDDDTLTEEDCGDMSRAILLLVLRRFRPDLVVEEGADTGKVVPRGWPCVDCGVLTERTVSVCEKCSGEDGGEDEE